MRKKLIFMIVMGILVGVAVSATALPQKCVYCGSILGSNTIHSTDIEDYNVPCSHGKFGSDHVTVTYSINNVYCNSCGGHQGEWWNPGGTIVTCHGWTIDEIRKEN